jgi:hypothetical protein
MDGVLIDIEYTTCYELGEEKKAMMVSLPIRQT